MKRLYIRPENLDEKQNASSGSNGWLGLIERHTREGAVISYLFLVKDLMIGKRDELYWSQYL